MGSIIQILYSKNINSAYLKHGWISTLLTVSRFDRFLALRHLIPSLWENVNLIKVPLLLKHTHNSPKITASLSSINETHFVSHLVALCQLVSWHPRQVRYCATGLAELLRSKLLLAFIFNVSRPLLGLPENNECQHSMSSHIFKLNLTLIYQIDESKLLIMA